MANATVARLEAKLADLRAAEAELALADATSTVIGSVALQLLARVQAGLEPTAAQPRARPSATQAATPAMTSTDQLEAERLIARLGELCGAPATIVWRPGLRSGLGLRGRTRAAAPDRLEVEPRQHRLDLLDTVAHEFVHSLEFRGQLPERRRVNSRGGRCSHNAPAAAPAIAAAVARGVGSLARAELAAILWAIAGAMPRALMATHRSTRV